MNDGIHDWHNDSMIIITELLLWMARKSCTAQPWAAISMCCRRVCDTETQILLMKLSLHVCLCVCEGMRVFSPLMSLNHSRTFNFTEHHPVGLFQSHDSGLQPLWLQNTIYCLLCLFVLSPFPFYSTHEWTVSGVSRCKTETFCLITSFLWWHLNRWHKKLLVLKKKCLVGQFA